MKFDWGFIARVFVGEARTDFCGTGFLVTRNHVLTCRHVVSRIDGKPWDGRLAEYDRSDIEILLRFGDDSGPVIERKGALVACGQPDLALIRLHEPLDHEPVRLVSGLSAEHEMELARSKSAVIGFSRELRLIEAPVQQFASPPRDSGTQRLLTLQMIGGLSPGMSGSPLIAHVRNQVVCIGMAYLGGDSSATSRLILSDTLIDFLMRCRVADLSTVAFADYFDSHSSKNSLWVAGNRIFEHAQFSDWINEALARHRQSIADLYSGNSAWGIPRMTLESIYCDTDCGLHTWGEIVESSRKGEGLQIDPFIESSAPRTDLLATTMQWIERPDFREFIVIQGTPGAGKSSFTIRLAVHLMERGYQPIRVRLRDLAESGDPLSGIATKSLQLDAKSLEYVLEYSEKRSVLILDGWDELSLVPNEPLAARIGRFLEAIRAAVLNRWQGRIPVVLTGRPSHLVTQSQTITSYTPILTIRPFTPQQLRTHFQKLGAIYSGSALKPVEVEGVLSRYEEDWNFAQNANTTRSTGTIDVIGWPLLAFLAYRLLRDCEPPRQSQLIENRTMLLRCLTEYCCQHSRRPSDDPLGSEVRSRFDPAELRFLVHETAIAITRRGTECIGLSEFRRAMNSRIGELRGERNLEIANSVDILLVNFLFKTSFGESGCEFVHKALREFAFAEAVVDQLKSLAVLVPSKPRSIELETEKRTPVTQLLSLQWLSHDVWEHIQSQLMWETYRESPEHEDPQAFRRPEPALGLDAWCRVRDHLATMWSNWGLYMRECPPTKQAGSQLSSLIDHVNILEESVADARLGEALFRLCAILHGVLAQVLLNRNAILKLTGNMWEDHGIVALDQPHQTTLHNFPDQRLRFFSPRKSSEEMDSRSLRAAMARINAHRVDAVGELPERCDLTLLVLIGAPLQRFSFQFCDLSHCNLSESNLSGVDLQGAEITNAFLFKANLMRANLKMADLSYSSLVQSNLEGANLKQANLRCANLQGAKGLSVEQVLQAENWESAQFDPELQSELRSNTRTGRQLGAASN